MAKAVLTFALYQGDTLSRRETVTQDIVKVGKDPKSHLRVDDEQASRMHAVIEVAGPEDITLIDLGNEPGTMVNGARVNKCKLHVGDQIQVGETYIVLESAEAAGAEAVAAPPAFGGAPNPFAASGSSPFAAASNPFEVRSANPFAAGAAATARAQALHVADDAPPGTYTYTMIKSGPDVSNDEVEIAHLQSVEVMILWGANVLHVSHLTPPRNFYVGEEQGKNFACDFFIPSEKLGTTRLPVVIGDRASVAVVIPPGARGSVELPGMPRMSMDEARQRAQPTAEVSGGHQLNLPSGGKARVEIGDFVFQVAAVNAGRPIKHGVAVGFDWGVAMYFGLSLAAVGGLVAAMAFFVPPMGLNDDEELDKDALYLMQQYLKSAAEREQEEKEAEVVQDNSDNKEGGTGTRAKGEEGSMGNPTTKAVNKRYAVQGPKDNPDPHIARQAALREAAEFGMIGLLNTGAAGDPNAPTAPWGRDTSSGSDDVSARGNMWGDEIGDAFGAPDGVTGFEIEGHHGAIGPAGRADDATAVNEGGFCVAPAGHHLAPEIGEHVLMPANGSVGGVEAEEVAILAEGDERIAGDGGLGAGAGVATAAAGLADFGFPEHLAIEVEGFDVAGIGLIALGEDLTIGDGHGGEAAAHAFGFPEEGGAAAGPLFEEAGFGGDAVAFGALPLGPRVVVLDGLGGNRGEEGGSEERDQRG